MYYDLEVKNIFEITDELKKKNLKPGGLQMTTKFWTSLK